MHHVENQFEGVDVMLTPSYHSGPSDQLPALQVGQAQSSGKVFAFANGARGADESEPHRWARSVACAGPRVSAVDAGELEQSTRTIAGMPYVTKSVQVDLRDLRQRRGHSKAPVGSSPGR